MAVLAWPKSAQCTGMWRGLRNEYRYMEADPGFMHADEPGVAASGVQGECQGLDADALIYKHPSSKPRNISVHAGCCQRGPLDYDKLGPCAGA